MAFLLPLPTAERIPVAMLLGAVGGGVALWLVRRFAPMANGSGIPQVKAFVLGKGDIEWRRLLPVKFIAGVFGIGGGLALGGAGEPVVVGELTIDPAGRTVKYKNKSIELTLTEFDILRRLAASPGETITRKDIIEAVRHNSKKPINDRTIDVHIRAIRKKMPEMQKHLSSVYGVGYRYDK